MADTVAERRQTLTGLTPDEDIGRCRHQEPAPVTTKPYRHTPGLNS
jgi:hypothetical protein